MTKAIDLLVALIIILFGLFMSFGILVYSLKEHDYNGFWGFLVSVPIVLMGAYMLPFKKNPFQNALPDSDSIARVEHSHQINDFLSFYIETRINGFLKYETVIDYLLGEYKIINIESQKSRLFSFEAGKDESLLEAEIKIQVEKIISENSLT